MDNLLKKIINGIDVENILNIVIENIFADGPINRSYLEILSYIKYFHPKLFASYEQNVLNVMGLFFKKAPALDFKSLIMKNIGDSIYEEYGENYTPIQMDIINNINLNMVYSFSAPTSTGKSFVFRDLIVKSQKDIVIIVPSRALINEYFIKVNELRSSLKFNILTHVDLINRGKNLKNVFILTPERAKEIFKIKNEIEIELVLFDEAQLSDDNGQRGVNFDILVRRFKRNFPNSKLLFSFPFIDNPESQIKKNHLECEQSYYSCYKERNVGQMFFSFGDNKFYVFGIDKGVMGNNKIEITFDPVEQILRKKGSVLIYTSKSKIISEQIIKDYEKYCNLCPEIEDEKAIDLIDKFNKYMGSSSDSQKSSYSPMSNLLKRGIILHHGSLPLQVRLIIEELTRLGYCRICFSTSTLVQGINMPFDAVLLDRFENKNIEMKNLIGRAGRSTTNPTFDYGIVVVKNQNISNIRTILNQGTLLNVESLLDTNRELPEDLNDYRDAIKNDEFNDDYNLTKKVVDRMNVDVYVLVDKVLNLLFYEGNIISGENFTNLDANSRKELYTLFQDIYKIYLGGRDLSNGEKSVISTAVKILLWQIQGKTFKQIVGYRYSYIRQNNVVKKLINKYKDKDKTGFKDEINKIFVKPTMSCSTIPNKELRFLPLFDYEMPSYKVNYDLVAFDTYDYMDKIIGFKLKDIYYMVFYEYYMQKSDLRAYDMSLYLKYGTKDSKEIMLLRYGFDFETIEWLKDKVNHVDENEISFVSLDNFTEEELTAIDRYL